MVMDYEGFKKEIYSLSGIDLSSYKEKQMKRRLDSLITKNGFENYNQYVDELKVNTNLYNEFINYMTINVSEFYRNSDQWEKLRTIILPVIIKDKKTLKVWSAACSSGDEPYTLVMILNEFFNLKNIKVVATDIDKDIIGKAKSGEYSEKSIANLPKPYVDKYFRKDGNVYRINDDVKSCVEFKHHNLLSDTYPSDCDLIVCRNVLIYFTEEAKVEIYKKFSNSLKKGGVLFVGSTEQIIMYSDYNLKSIQTFFYQKNE